MDDFLVAGPADNPEEALALMRATAIASFGEAVRDIARQNFSYCNVHRRAIPRPEPANEEAANAYLLPDPANCICPAEAAPGPMPTPGLQPIPPE